MGGETSCASGSPTSSSPVRPVQVPHRGSQSSTKAVLFRRTPIPPIPHASAQQARLAPMPDRDARPPPDPNSSPHTEVSLTDFRPPTVDTDAGFPYGSRFRSPRISNQFRHQASRWPSRCDCHSRPRTLQRFASKRRRTRAGLGGAPAVGGRIQRRLLLLQQAVQEALNFFACRDRYCRLSWRVPSAPAPAA